MKEIFASIYEWFGIIPLYSTDMGDLLRGWDITCTDYIATPWYVYIGWIMIILTAFTYALQYHIIDSSKYNKRKHWWFFAALIVITNFLIAFSITFNIIQTGDYCTELTLSVSDSIGFGISNALWSFILLLITSTVPFIRRFSTNCRHTTFWKP
ncbi:MAG: hypothetical protein SFW35_00515 [Chitinophagales bacterium]|nr:hypothetical protein [Chitinophagales bacterium]